MTHSAKTDKADADEAARSRQAHGPGVSGEVAVPRRAMQPAHELDALAAPRIDPPARRAGAPTVPKLESHEDAESPASGSRDEHETESVVVRKNARLKAKVSAARAHLERLPKTDRRSRLLHAAVVRRDEILLDALLQELDG